VTARWLFDYRCALVNREGTGRAARELVRALLARSDAPAVDLFGWTLAPTRVAEHELGIEAPLASGRTRLLRRRIPHRATDVLLRALRLGLDDLGSAALVHHFQLSHLPVRAALQTGTIYDTLWSDPNSAWLAPKDALGMAHRAHELARRCARIHAPSGHAADSIASVLGFPRARIDVVPLGADHLQHRPECGTAPREDYLFTAARLDARKNHIAVLRALERLDARGLCLPWVVAGPPGHGCEPFFDALAKSKVRARVHVVGELDENDLAAHHRAARLFVFPSLGEGFGLPPLEAMGFGVPTVASGAGSLAEVLGEGAWSVEPDDVDGLADAIEALWPAGALRERWRTRARERAALFTWDRAADAALRAWQCALREAA